MCIHNFFFRLIGLYLLIISNLLKNVYTNAITERMLPNCVSWSWGLVLWSSWLTFCSCCHLMSEYWSGKSFQVSRSIFSTWIYVYDQNANLYHDTTSKHISCGPHLITLSGYLPLWLIFFPIFNWMVHSLMSNVLSIINLYQNYSKILQLPNHLARYS